MYPFERFNEEAKRTLSLAQKEAERSHHSYIGTEHLLLALLAVESGTAFRVLTRLGISVGRVRESIKAVLGRNERIIIQQIIPTSRVKKVIEISFEEAQRMRHNYVDTGHMLMGLVIEGEGIAAHVLADLGAPANRVIEEVERELGAPPSGRGKPPRRLRLRFRLPRRLHFGAPTSILAQSGWVTSQVNLIDKNTDIDDLARLLHSPRIAKLLEAKGVDTEALVKGLLAPPPVVLELRRKLASLRMKIGTTTAAQDSPRTAKLRGEENALLKRLEAAEQAWLDSLA